MIMEAQMVKNGLFIPMMEPFPTNSSDKIWVGIELLVQNQKELERKRIEAYLTSSSENRGIQRLVRRTSMASTIRDLKIRGAHRMME